MIISSISNGFQLKNGNYIVVSCKKILKIRNKLMIRYDNIDNKYDKDYYIGMISNTNIEESVKKDNLTPNLKLGGIFLGLIIGLLIGFFYINKDIPPQSF